MQIINKKGFSIMELAAIMAIMAILAAASASYIRKYMKEAANGRAKAGLRILAEAYKDCKLDNPGKNISIDSTEFSKYKPKNLSGDYDFLVGKDCKCGHLDDLACMKGKGGAPFDTHYCAWINKYGDLDATCGVAGKKECSW
jgi:Tfp pilus assembly protein PilE